MWIWLTTGLFERRLKKSKRRIMYKLCLNMNATDIVFFTQFMIVMTNIHVQHQPDDLWFSRGRWQKSKNTYIMPNYVNATFLLENVKFLILHFCKNIPSVCLVQISIHSDCCIKTVIMYEHTKNGEKTVLKRVLVPRKQQEPYFFPELQYSQCARWLWA